MDPRLVRSKNCKHLHALRFRSADGYLHDFLTKLWQKDKDRWFYGFEAEKGTWRVCHEDLSPAGDDYHWQVANYNLKDITPVVRRTIIIL